MPRHVRRIHIQSPGGQLACGQRGRYSVVTADPAAVTCRTCLALIKARPSWWLAKKLEDGA
jgi:hypothetical protein